MTRPALGRGLSALIPAKPAEGQKGESVRNIPVDQIFPSRFQPRTVFNPDALRELADSIRERGIIQPVIVTEKKNGFELIAGERRWRAVKSLGLKEIPAIVKIVRDSDALEMALIENIQRENLNPVEEGHAYERLMNEFALTQEALSKKVGKNRSTVANFLRLLKLPDRIKDDLSDGRLTMGHARALLALDDEKAQIRLRDDIINAGMNVRQAESHAKSRSSKPARKTGRVDDVHVKKAALMMERRLGVKVEIKPKAKGGSIVIHYHDLDELNRVLDLIEAK
ncbi:MAG: ParB/RepB/Spo0J family partition protein [Nitrospinae bacterium]|nr:ParB/RepB/Spo0J family partition protein [Nitrospinota bacterium]MBF0635099.1 ParB/RepB/Spo0J family partition protein [Nitrospinota bacterium]